LFGAASAASNRALQQYQNTLRGSEIFINLITFFASKIKQKRIVPICSQEIFLFLKETETGNRYRGILDAFRSAPAVYCHIPRDGLKLGDADSGIAY